MRRTRRVRAGWLAPCALWITCVGAGLGALAVYAHTPGPAAATPAEWPANGGLRHRGRPTLVVFAHPRCACTRATLAELARLLARLPRPCDATLVFAGEGDDLRAAAAAIDGMRIVDDPARVRARRFGATTSGHVFFYDAERRLRYCGGITPGRGHEGDSTGAAAIAAHAAGRDAPAAAPVYGCPLFSTEGDS